MAGTAELEPIKATVVDSSLDGIVVVGEDGCVVALNPAAEGLFGWSQEEATGRPIGELIVPEHLREAHVRGFSAYVAGGPPTLLGKRIEVQALHRDGRLIPVELIVLEIRVEGRRVFTATVRDRSADAAQQEALEQARRQLELAVEGAQLGTWSYNPRTRVSWYSDKVREIVGFEDNFLADGEAFRQRVHPDDRDQLVFDRDDGFPEGRVAREYRIVRPDGEARWLYSLGAAARDASGAVEAIHGVIIDITERKRAEEELELARERLALAVDGARLGVWSFDVRTGRTWYSDRSKQMYGLAPDAEMTAGVIQASLHPDDWDETSHPYIHGFDEDRLEVEYRVLRPDGSERWIYSLGAVVRDADGVAHTVNGIHLDVTERKRADEELAETRRQLELAIAGAKIGSWTVDPETGATWYSDRSREIHGLGRELRLDAKTLKAYIHPDDWELVLASYRAGFPGDAIELEHRVVWPNGDVRWVQSIGTALRDASAKVHTVSGIHLDITDRKQAEMELARSRDALLQSEKLASLGTLLAGVSHELNNPLAAIVGQAEMLEEDTRGTEFAERARKIRSAAERSARIVQTFLAMARQRDGQRVMIDVNKLIASALELTEYALRTSGIAVRVIYGTALPPVEGDRDQLHQVLVNLIVNAQQAMEKGEAFEKVLTVRASLSQAGRVLVDITDTGPGVPAEMRARIFEPFFSTKKQGSGTGIGLSFSQGIVEAHGGTLRVEPSRDGAHFRIDLPAAPDSPIVAVPRDEVVAPPQYTGRRRVLVVEDEPDVAETLRELIEREGFEVTLAGNGTEAFFALDKGDFDILFSDLRMPLLNGPELYERLCEIRPDLVRHMAFVTGDTVGDSMDEFLKACGRPILEKPFTRAGIRAVLAALIAPEAAR